MFYDEIATNSAQSPNSHNVYCTFIVSSFSKCFRALRMFNSVAADAICMERRVEQTVERQASKNRRMVSTGKVSVWNAREKLQPKRTNVGVVDDHHGIGVGSEGLNVCRKVLVANLHAVELRGHFTAGELELLDNVANLLKAGNLI